MLFGSSRGSLRIALAAYVRNQIRMEPSRDPERPIGLETSPAEPQIAEQPIAEQPIAERSLVEHPIVAAHRVVVTLGGGGVGKTTTAAALSVHAALCGKRVLCLTIDPARRLANSLGLTEMTVSEQDVPAELFASHGLTLTGQLSAMMLDTKRTFDDLVGQYASTPEAKDRILNNGMYQYVSSSLAGTQEYMAMEKLYAVRKDPRWDLIVLDTPPTANALDFLAAPEKLIEAIDSPAMRWFVQGFGSGTFSLKALGRGAAFLLRGLSKFTGAGFLQEVAAFVTGINDLFGGFRQRAHVVAEALRSSDVAFMVVTRPSAAAVDESLFLAQRLNESEIDVASVVINNVHPIRDDGGISTADLVAEAERTHAAEGFAGGAERLVERMRRAFDDEQALARAERAEIERLRAQIADRVSVVEVPAFDEDVHDLGALARLAAHLNNPKISNSHEGNP